MGNCPYNTPDCSYAPPTVQLSNTCPQLTYNGTSQTFTLVVTPRPTCILEFYSGTTLIESIQVTNKSGGSTTSTVCATPTIDYNPITIKVKNDTGNSSISCDWYGITLFGNNNSYAYYRKDAVSVIFLYANDIALLYGMALSTAQTWFEEYVIIKGLRIPSGSKSGVLAYIFFTLLTILGANCITDLNGNSNITILNSVITAIQNATTSQQYQLTINNDTVNFTYDPLNGAIVI